MLLNIAREFISSGSTLETLAGSGSVLTGGAVVKSIQSVPDGYVGLRTRFKNARLPHANGKDPLELTEDDIRSFVTHGRLPKFHWPLSHSICLISTRDRVAVVNTTADNKADGTKPQLIAQGNVTWGVKSDKVSVYRALYMPMGGNKGLPDEANLVKQVESELGSGFRLAIKSLSEAQRDDREVLKDTMISICAEGLARYGSEIRHVNLEQDTRALGQMMIEAAATQNRFDSAINGYLASQVQM